MGVFFMLLLAGPLLLLLLQLLVSKRQWQAGRRTKRIIISGAVLFTLLYIAALVMSGYRLYFRGYRSTSFIFLLMWLLWGLCALLCLPRRFLLRQGILVICGIGWALSAVLLAELLSDYRRQLIYNSPRYRLEDTGRGIMNACKLPDLFVKNGLLERRYLLDSSWGFCFKKRDFDSAVFTQLPGNRLEVKIFHFLKDTSKPNPVIRVVQLK